MLQPLRRGTDWLDRIDPGGRRRIRGLRLAAAFAIASMAATLALPNDALNAAACAGGFAIWSSLFENAATRRRGVTDLGAIILAGSLGAAISILWITLPGTADTPLRLLPVAAAAFLVDYAKPHGTLATSAASMGFIGLAIGLGLGLTASHFPMLALATLIAIVTATTLRTLGGPSERDSDALARCRDIRRIMAARLRRCHDALHVSENAGLPRILPRSNELTTAWADLLSLVRGEFTDADLLAVTLNAELRHLYALLQIVLAIGDALGDLQAATPLRERAAIGLVLHTLRRIVLQDTQSIDPADLQTLAHRCDRLVIHANAATDLPIETRIALLRIGLITGHGIALAPPPVSPPLPPPLAGATGRLLPTTRIAIQAGLAALAVIVLNSVLPMSDVLWALIASTYVISSSVADTWSRGLRRIVGTAIGVALGLGTALLIAPFAPIVWLLAVLAIIAYAMWLPTRYDIACGAYAFALVVMLAQAGVSSWATASGRLLDTLVGAAIGMIFSLLVLPVRLRDQLNGMLVSMLLATRDRVADALARTADAAHAAPPEAADGANLLAEIAAEKSRFAGLRLEGLLAHDHTGGAVILLNIDGLVAATLRLVGESRLAAGQDDPALRDVAARVAADLGPAFDAVLIRLHHAATPLMQLPPPAAPQPVAATPTVALIVAAMSHTSRRVIVTLDEIAAELDRRKD